MKQDLRERILTLLRKQGAQARAKNSQIILEKLFLYEQFQKAEHVLLYAAFDGEVETFEIIQKALHIGKTIGLPKIDKNMNTFTPMKIQNLDQQLHSGEYGILEPKEVCEEMPIETIDCVVVPGVVFDKKNNRLGRGGGYYDRFLSRLSNDVSTIGLAFDFQIVESLPHIEKHDVSVTHVISN